MILQPGASTKKPVRDDDFFDLLYNGFDNIFSDTVGIRPFRAGSRIVRSITPGNVFFNITGIQKPEDFAEELLNNIEARINDIEKRGAFNFPKPPPPPKL